MEGPMHCWQFLVANLEPARLPDPRERALNHPADLTQPAAMRGPRLRQVVFNPPLPQAGMVPRRAVGSVPVQSLRLAARPAPPTTNRRDVVYQVHRLDRVVTLRTRDAHGQRRSLAVHQQVAFRAFVGSIRGIFAGQRPPKTARILWLSTTAFDQSMPFSWPTRWRSSWSSVFHTPRRCQYRSRRQQVAPEPHPISTGSIHQGMPLCNTNTIPVKHARSSTGGRPRLPLWALCRGSSGWTTSQSSSGTNGLLIAAPPPAGVQLPLF